MGCCFGSNKVSDDKKEILKKDSYKSKSSKQAPTLEDLTEDWKTLISTLNSNQELTSYALSKPRSEFKSVKELGDYLSRCEIAHSSVEKAWLVYLWVTENISYDADDFKEENHAAPVDSQSALESGVSICAGYADLYKVLCTRVGVECVAISGYAKGFNYRIGSRLAKENHWWNAVKCDGKWKFVDSTWGAGFVTNDLKFVKNFKPYYFATPPHIFNETHFSDSFQSNDLLHAGKKKSLNEFEKLHANTVDYHVCGLKCTSYEKTELNYSEIRTPRNPLVIEYTSTQRVHLKARLFDPETNNKIKNATIIQSDFSKPQNVKYCTIAELPQKNKDYLLVLYGCTSTKEPVSDASFPELTKYLVQLIGDEINENIPQYNLSFDYHIKLRSHFSQLIKFETNPLIMEFIVPNLTQAQFKVTKRDETPVENAVLAQKLPEHSTMLVNVSLPKPNETYFLKLYAKHAKDPSSKSFNYVSQFQLVRFQTDQNDKQKYCTLFATDFKYFIYSPTDFYLSANKPYDFKCMVKDAVKVALQDNEKKWHQLEMNQEEPNVWLLKKTFASKGKLTLFAQFEDKKSYSGMCSYEIVA